MYILHMQIILQPVALEEGGRNITSSLASYLSKEFHASVNIAQAIKAPEFAFDKQRNQWKSNDLLQWLFDRYNPNIKTKILAICNIDAYSNKLNFVFGEAYFNGRVAAIYLARLRHDFYGLKSAADESLLFERIVKEAVHELGHTFGLNHCKNIKCVMYFSNSLYDTDVKGRNFCERCQRYLLQR
jgi:archaemetzincin